MSWIITNNKFFIRSDRRGCAAPVIDRRKAKIFEERYNAEEFLRSLPKTMKNLGYYITPLNAQAPVAAKEVRKPDESRAIMIDAQAGKSADLTDPGYYINAIGAFREFIQTIRTARPKLEEQQIQAEMEVEDLLHAIEFYDLPNERGYELYQNLHDARIRRRNYKNAVAWIDFVLEADPDSFLRRDPSSGISGSQHRQYRPRALPTLFELHTEERTTN